MPEKTVRRRVKTADGSEIEMTWTANVSGDDDRASPFPALEAKRQIPPPSTVTDLKALIDAEVQARLAKLVEEDAHVKLVDSYLRDNAAKLTLAALGIDCSWSEWRFKHDSSPIKASIERRAAEMIERTVPDSAIEVELERVKRKMAKKINEAIADAVEHALDSKMRERARATADALVTEAFAAISVEKKK